MKESRFTEEQIIGVLREQEAGGRTAEVCRQLAQPLPDVRRIPPLRPAHRLRVNFDQPAGAALREAVLRYQAKRRIPPRRRHSQFFDRRYFSAALSSICSASSFFRRRFSSSSPFSRAAYDASEVSVAVEEGMPDGESDLLRRILLALDQLGGGIDMEQVGPTKQHGIPRSAIKRE